MKYPCPSCGTPCNNPTEASQHCKRKFDRMGNDAKKMERKRTRPKNQW